ncbi:MAG: FmdB family transcriptional regulator [Actinomycetota bacterium]|nr:FmdB family transcriptional regulator [Actinomycetota bacterium]
MPTYEYACADCANRVEVYRRVDEEPLTICEVCGGRLRKVFHPTGIVFRGSGFYKTDSRKGGGEQKPAAAGASSADGGSAEPKKGASEGASKESSRGSSTEPSKGAAPTEKSA